MKVLRAGRSTSKQPWRCKHKCKQCKSVLLVEEGDIKMEGVGGYAAYAEAMVPSITCPVCGQWNRLPDRKVPKQFKSLYGDGFSPASSRRPVF